MPNISIPLSEDSKNILSVSWGELAKQANGSVTISLGETVVLVTACMSPTPIEKGNFLPLTVEYMGKTYAMGKIPGGFIKREGRPKDTEILSARVIDRSIRPLFPQGLRNELQIVAMVLSSDGENDPDVLAINGASLALFLSDIPFNIPIGAVRVAKRDNEFIINPSYEEREHAEFELIVVATEEKVVMLEGKMNQIDEEALLEAIKNAMVPIKNIIIKQKELYSKLQINKRENIELKQIKENIVDMIKNEVESELEKIYGLAKEEREKAINEILSRLKEKYLGEGQNENDFTEDDLIEAFYFLDKKFVRNKILLEKKRPDNRELDQIRSIECKVGVLPRPHGSAIFTRGQTQSLAITTLGTSGDEQIIEALEGEKFKHFMLHYSFPPFSTGEVRPIRGPSRREIGHGALAEKSLLNVIPSKDEFPYTIRVVSEILESNGSSSMATVCAASLSLMDAGVPIKEPVGGIAIGLIQEDNKYCILTDIAGVEDHYGDMDFKIAGTKNGITAVQLDIKIDGIGLDIIKESLIQAKKARIHIIEEMNKALAMPRESVSKHAPRIKSFKIDVDKIGDIIGPGGRVIRKIIRENNVTIDIDDEDGTVSVVADNQESLDNAINQIISITKDIEVGEEYNAKVVQITNFGAFCELFPGKTGLLHISEISEKFVRDIRQYLKEGDIIRVKVINIDSQGRINLSMKQI